MTTLSTLWEIESPLGPVAFRVSGQGRPVIFLHGWGLQVVTGRPHRHFCPTTD